MILAVDVGNTNIVFGGFDNNGVNCALYQGSTHRFQEWKISMR